MRLGLGMEIELNEVLEVYYNGEELALCLMKL